jgi:hypothetical protein
LKRKEKRKEAIKAPVIIKANTNDLRVEIFLNQKDCVFLDFLYDIFDTF